MVANRTDAYKRTTHRQATPNCQPDLVVLESIPHHFYDLGLSIFALPYASKTPVSTDNTAFSWQQNGLTERRIHRDSIPEIFAGDCNLAVITGRVSGNLFVLDCDDMAAAAYHKAQMQRRGIPVFGVLTGKGKHFYFRCLDGEVANLPKLNLDSAPDQRQRLSNVDIKGNNSYIVGPGSLHPEGRAYTFDGPIPNTIPSVHIADLDWFTDANGQPFTLPLRKTRGLPLKASTLEYFQHGHSYPEGIRNNSLFDAALDLYCHGQDTSPLHGEATASGLPDSEVTRTIKSATSGKYGGGQRSQPTHWRRALHFTHTHQWTGRTGQTDRAVFLASVDLAKTRSRSTDEFFMAYRDIMPRARIANRTTVSNALQRLRTAGLLVQIQEASGRHAAVWRFGDEVMSLSPYCTTVPTVQTMYCSGSVRGQNDLCEIPGIGRSGAQLYTALLQSSQPVKRAHLSKLANLSDRQVKRVLSADNPLRQAGLVTSPRRGYWQAVPQADDALQALADQYGVSGKAQERYRKVELERQWHVSRAMITWRIRHDPLHPHYQPKRDKAAESPPQHATAATVERQPAPVPFPHDTPEKPLKTPENGFEVCPTCGQTRAPGFSDSDLCPYCQDMTTWQHLEADPLLLEMEQLGGQTNPIVGDNLMVGWIPHESPIVGDTPCSERKPMQCQDTHETEQPMKLITRLSGGPEKPPDMDYYTLAKNRLMSLRKRGHYPTKKDAQDAAQEIDANRNNIPFLTAYLEITAPKIHEVSV